MRPLDGYPTPIGSSVLSIFPHKGPVVYAQIAQGAAPAVASGGDTVQAGPEAGIKYFDTVIGGITDSGKYRVDAIPKGRSAGPVGQPATTCTLQWWVISTGAQVANGVDLSAEIIRLTAIGPK